MIRTKKCKCSTCDRVRDYPYNTNEGRCPEKFPCECGGEAEWTFQGPQNYIHTEKSSLYDPHRVDPRFGRPVASYQEKKALLKEKGMEEVDVERYDDIQNDVAAKSAAQAQHKRDPNTLIADSLEEINRKISTNAAAQGATQGDFSKRESYDRDTGLVDSWGGF